MTKKIMAVPGVIPAVWLMLLPYAYAGAWTCSKARTYNKFGLNYYNASKEFDANGHRKNFSANGEFQDVNANYYLEYGYTDDLAFIGSLYYKYIELKYNDSKRDSWGIGDIDVASRYKLLDSSVGVVSVQGLIKIPGPYDENEALPLGNKQFDFEGRFLYGRSLWPHIPGYCNFELAYRYRAELPADEFRYLAEFGMDCTKQIYGRVKLDGILNIGNGEDTTDPNGNPSTTNEFDLGKLDIALGYKMTPKWAVEIGYVPDVYGENISAGANYSLAVVCETD